MEDNKMNRSLNSRHFHDRWCNWDWSIVATGNIISQAGPEALYSLILLLVSCYIS